MKTSREKAALGVFLFLAVAALGVVIAYIVTLGHSLNVAASKIDDAAGNLDGYTALLYQGTAESRRATVVNASAQDSGSLGPRALNRQSSQKGESQGNEVSAAQASSAVGDGQEGQQRSVSLFSLRVSYVEKQAAVITVDVEHPEAYNERCIVRANGKTFGFVYIDEVTAWQSYLQKRIADYKLCGVDMVVCVTKEIGLLRSYQGATIVVSQQEEGLSPHGASAQGVFYDDAALKGQVGSILVSPSRTITAKDVSAV